MVREEGDAVDRSRPSSPKAQALLTKEEETMTKLEAIIKKEQMVSLLATDLYVHESSVGIKFNKISR